MTFDAAGAAKELILMLRQSSQKQITLISHTALGFLATLSLSASASFKHFEAPMSDSTWRFQGNPLGCQLEHPIPMYGKARFRKVAGNKEELAFDLSYNRHQLNSNTIANVRALAPAWQPQLTARELGEVKVSNGPHVFTSQKVASWKLLNELEIGRLPTFYYSDFNSPEDQVAVSLSTIGFKSEYGKFLDCLTSLVPYKLDELQQLTLYFDFDQTKIKSRYREQLNALANYIKYDPEIDIVIINGYTDNKGSRYYNQKLSEKRAQKVKEQLQLAGVDDSRFKLSAFGEKKPAASNRTANGRALNRRVYLKIMEQ